MLAGVIVAALLQAGGVASVLPFLTVVSDPSTIHTNAILSRVYTGLGFTTANGFLFFLGFLALAVLLISDAVQSVVYWGMVRFSYMRNYSLSRRLLASYLHRPYTFFLNENTATLGRNILSETNHVITGAMLPALRMFASAVVVLFLLALLIAVQPVLILILGGSIALIYGAIYFFMRRKLTRLGIERLEANAERFKAANEAFGGIKLVKLLRKEDTFERRFSKHSYRLSSNTATESVLGGIPRYALEAVAFGGIIVIVLYLLATKGNLAQVLPLVGMFAYAGYRMMPAMNTIFQGAAQLRYNSVVLDTLREGLQMAPILNPLRSEDASPLPFVERLELQGVTFRYPNTTRPAVRDLCLIIKTGSSVAFAGKTGAGKTTISDIILGLLTPQQGDIRVDGVEITGENLHRWQRNLGYVPQDIYLQDDTIAANIAFGTERGEIDMGAVKRAARIANIHDFIVHKLPHGYDTMVGERGARLSGGERQRVGIARALYHDPSVLVLDEAASALDGATEQAVFEAIESIAGTKTLIIIAHRLTTVRNCDMVYVIDDGRIAAQGTYDELMESDAGFRQMAQVHT